MGWFRHAPRRRLATARTTATIAVCALLLGGCQGTADGPQPASSASPLVAGAQANVTPWSQLRVAPDPASIIGPSTAIVTNADIEPISTDPSPHLPAVVKDVQDTTVTVRSVDRVLALDLYGSLAATVYGLGLGPKLVGRDESTGFPAAAHLPVVTGNGHQLNAESILKLRPSLLITDTTLGPWNVVLQLRAAGIAVVVVDSKRSVDNLGELVGQVADALGVPSQGAALSARLANELAETEQRITAIAPKPTGHRLRILFLYARGQSGVFFLFGKGTGADSLIKALSGVDVATEAGIDGFSPLNAEALARTKPDVILMMSAGLASVGGVSGAVRLPGVAQTPAGQHRRIVDMSDYQLLSFGPLTAAVLDGLARAIYAP